MSSVNLPGLQWPLLRQPIFPTFPSPLFDAVKLSHLIPLLINIWSGVSYWDGKPTPALSMCQFVPLSSRLQGWEQ